MRSLSRSLQKDIANDAFKLRNNITDLNDAVLTTKGFLKKLQSIAVEVGIFKVPLDLTILIFYCNRYSK